MGSQKVKDMVSKCRLSHAFEQWCIAFAAQASWRAVPEELHRLLIDAFSGWIQSRVNEKANKVWRDACRRDNASGIVMTMRVWEKLTTQKVLGEFCRQEVQWEGGDALFREDMGQCRPVCGSETSDPTWR